MLRATSQDSVAAVRRLLEASLPVPLPASYYSELGGDVVPSLELYSENELIGQISWRCTTTELEEEEAYMYTLAVDVRHRDEGHGQRLFEAMLTACAPRHISLHVQSTNEQAIRFYTRMGFDTIQLVPRYYGRLGDAYLMRRQP